MKDIFIAAPDGQAGGGMGRVKDYILQTPPDVAGQYRIVPLVTRDGRGIFFSVLLLATGIARVAYAALRGRAGLLHVNMGDRGSIARKGILLLSARMWGVPTVLHLHAAELEESYNSAGPLARLLIRWPFHAATCVVVLGERVRKWGVSALDVPQAKIRVLYNGVEAATALRSRQHMDVQTLLFLGNLDERKGMSDLLRALSLLPPETPRWRAILAGGGNIVGYQSLAAQLGLSDRVEFPGWADRAGVTQLLKDATALVLPSYDEGLPLVILEAMGCGLPVISTPVGVIPEVLTDDETVLFVDPGDSAGLAERIAALLGDRNLQARLAANAAALFDRDFSLHSFQSSLFDIYRQCCGVDYVPQMPEASIASETNRDFA